jgi:hypothetical protein
MLTRNKKSLDQEQEELQTRNERSQRPKVRGASQPRAKLKSQRLGISKSFEEHKEEENSTFFILIATSQRGSTSPIF